MKKKYIIFILIIIFLALVLSLLILFKDDKNKYDEYINNDVVDEVNPEFPNEGDIDSELFLENLDKYKEMYKDIK